MTPAGSRGICLQSTDSAYISTYNLGGGSRALAPSYTPRMALLGAAAPRSRVLGFYGEKSPKTLNILKAAAVNLLGDYTAGCSRCQRWG